MAEANDTESILSQALIDMRESYSRGDYDQVLALFEGLGDTSKIRSGIRVEAASLAARAHVAVDRKRQAVVILKREWEREINSPRLCAHLAIACLEAGEYDRAAGLSEKAATLKQVKSSQAGAA